MGSLSAGLASSAGVVHVPQPRRVGRFMLIAEPSEAAEASAAAAGEEQGPVPAALVPVVVGAARLMQHPALLAHPLAGGDGDSGGGGGVLGPGRYLAHAPLVAASVLHGVAGLQGADYARGSPLLQPVLLVASGTAVLFARGGLEAVLVLPLAATGAPLCCSGWERSGCVAELCGSNHSVAKATAC